MPRRSRAFGVHVGGEGDGEAVSPLGEDVETARFDFEALDASAELGREGGKAGEQEIADAFLVVGDRFDIDQGAREFEDVHSHLGGKPGRRKARPDRRRVSSPIALHPPEKRVTVGRY